MARPRVFISSTFYDLRHIRADLERFIREMGYEPVLNERGSIAYGSTQKLEEYCYKEVGLCDVIVAIIGGRYGTASQHGTQSISQMEVKTALEHGKQVYIFIEQGVLSEYSTYKNNKGVAGLHFQHVDDPKVYAFIEEIEQLPMNNTIAAFQTSRDIADYLREQWAGLFQRFLQEAGRQRETQLLKELQATAKTLDQLVSYLTEERRNQDSTIKSILLTNHPIFQQLAKQLRVSYRVFFTNCDELEAWLRARQFARQQQFRDLNEPQEWTAETKEERTTLTIAPEVFSDDARLRIYTAKDWNPDWVRVTTSPIPKPPFNDDDIPF